MSHEERQNLLTEIEQIRATIERLHPVAQEQEMTSAPERDNTRMQLLALRKHLAREMEHLHAGS